MEISLVDFFIDPLFRAPMIATMLMSLCASLIGAIFVARGKALVSEVLSHASYPGIMLGVILLGGYLSSDHDAISLVVLLSAFVLCFLGEYCVEFLSKRKFLNSDVALCYTLSGFLGLGVLFASVIQQVYPVLFQRVQMFLYGQAATMGEVHIKIFSIFALVITSLVILHFQLIKGYCFDKSFIAQSGHRSGWLELMLIALLSVAISLGIRSVGVVLMSGLIIAPPIAARTWTKRLSSYLVLSVCIGLLCSCLGVYCSVAATRVFGLNASLPSGPLIVLFGCSACILSFLLSPKQGLVIRWWRQKVFHRKCFVENLLKVFWKNGIDKSLSQKEICSFNFACVWNLPFKLWVLKKQGVVKRGASLKYELTEDGKRKANYIVRLHRLWEVYLASHLGFATENIHRNAEEMEHIITPEVEDKLTKLLLDPKQDPHKQPIPAREEI